LLDFKITLRVEGLGWHTFRQVGEPENVFREFRDLNCTNKFMDPKIHFDKDPDDIPLSLGTACIFLSKAFDVHKNGAHQE
jgi:hypothetical protein